MANTQFATRASAPIPPRRPSSHAVLIALLVLALIFVGGVLALFYGLRIVSRSISIHEERTVAGNKIVSINTPLGNLNVDKGNQVEPALLGLPIYPGARRAQEGKSAQVDLNLPGQKMVGVVTAQFETPDSLGRVKNYYQKQLDGQTTKITIDDFGQKVVFEIKREDQKRAVALKGTGNGTVITLVRVRHGTAEAN